MPLCKPSGWADTEIEGARENLNPLLDLILNHVKPAKFQKEKPFAMLSTLLYADSFLGRSLVGRITQGTAKANQSIKAINKLIAFYGFFLLKSFEFRRRFCFKF